jgi:hypothetical protein
MESKKVIIISDILPSKFMTAGNVLSLLHEEISNEQEIIYICLHNIELKYLVFEQIGSQSVYFFERPVENWNLKYRVSIFSKAINLIGELLSVRDSIFMSREIIKIINRENPATVLHVIESKTSIQVSNRVLNQKFLKSINIGVYWDPIEWWIKSRKTNLVISKYLILLNNKNILKYDKIIAPSDNMKNYLINIGAKSVETMYPFYE